MHDTQIRKKSALSYAIPMAIPIGISFFFVGIGFGLYATSLGFPWWVPMALAMTIFAGSLEFIIIGLLLAGFDALNALLLTLFVNGRHIFYGLSMLSKYTDMGWKWVPTVSWMCDESFAVNATVTLPDDVDAKWFYFHISWMNYMAWALSTFVGGLFGNFMTAFDLRGIEFVLPGLFITIFVDMLLTTKNNAIRAFGLGGMVMAVLMLLLVGKLAFMLATMICMLVICYIAYKWGGVRFD